MRKQREYLNELKSKLAVGQVIVVLVFSENYAFQIQESIQQYYYNSAAATLLPVIIYYKNGDEINNLFLIGISHCLTHDSTAVFIFQKELISFL